MSADLTDKNNNSSQRLSKATFYIDQVPSQPSQYIFDELYKSKQNKRKFSKDRRFSYFNNMLKIKNKYESSNYLYSKIFTKPVKSRQANSNITQEIDETKSFRRSLEITGTTAQKYRIQMLNSQTYKIYRPIVRKPFDFQPQNSPLHSKNIDIDQNKKRKISVQKKSPEKSIPGIVGVSFHFCIENPRPRAQTSGNNRRQKIENSLNEYIQANHQGKNATLSIQSCQRHMRRNSAPQPRLKMIPTYTGYEKAIRRPIHSRGSKYTLQ